MNTFGNWLKEQRVERNMTMSGFSKLIDVTDAYVSQLEKGQKKPSLNILNRISKRLEVSFLFLLSLLGYPVDLDENYKSLAKENSELKNKLNKIQKILEEN